MMYSRSAKGGIQEWGAEVYQDSGGIYIKTVWGDMRSAKQEKETPVAKGKNAGKSNATSPETQAIFEKNSLYTRKQREGYKSLDDLGIIVDEDSKGELYGLIDAKLPKNNLNKENNLLPMKARPYYKDDEITPRIKFPCYAQPKVNGFRCVATLETFKEGLFDITEVKFRSKHGLEFPILTHIAKQFKPENFKVDNIEGVSLVFDGEMYIPGMYLQEIASAVKKVNENTKRIEFHIFDLANDGLRQETRLAMISKVLTSTSFIKIVPSTLVTSDAEAQAFTDKCIEQGYEGAIFRDIDATYQFGKRPTTMVKLKRYKDGEFLVLDVILPTSEESEYCTLKLANDINDETFESTPEGTHEYKKELYNNKVSVIGKLATVQYYERTKEGKPFHSKVVAIRDYEK